MPTRIPASRIESLRWIALLFLLVSLVGCASHRGPVLEPLLARPERNPVVLIPGITGSRLADLRTDKMVWGEARQVFLPRDGAARLIRPVTVPVGEDSGGVEGDGIGSVSAVTELRLLGLIRVDIYASLVEMLEGNGYRSGEIDSPDSDSDLYLFHYDWRQSSVLAVERLVERLEAIRRARGEERLTVDLICQSNAGVIARYLVKYGGVSLEAAELGIGGLPPSIEVDKMILVGNAHGGALDVLEDLHRGRRYVPWIGRRMRPETIFTFPSVIETLPVRPERPFVDAEGEPIDARLHDAESWIRYGLSVWNEKTQRRLAKSPSAGLADEAARRAYLEQALDRAERLQALLGRDVPRFGATRYYSIQNAYLPTPVRALLEPDAAGGWRLGLPGDRRVRRDPYLWSVLAAPGDGHASLDSQQQLSPQEQAAQRHPAFLVPTTHRKIIHHPASHRRILEFLLE